MVLLAVTARQAWAATVIRMGHVAFPGSLLAVVNDEYAKRVNEALKGRYEVKVFHSSQLGTDEEMLKGIKVGVLEMFQPSTIMSTVDAKFGVFEMPYLFKDRDHVKRASEDPKIKEILFNPLPEKGLRLLGVWENGFRVITNNVRPIVKPEDMKGIKLRVPSGVWRVKMFRAYGANPTPLAYGEVFAALQAGVMDGQENPFFRIDGLSLFRSDAGEAGARRRAIYAGERQKVKTVCCVAVRAAAHRRRIEEGPVSRTVPCHAPERHGSAFCQCLLGQQKSGDLCRCRHRRAFVQLPGQVRFRHGLAQFHKAYP